MLNIISVESFKSKDHITGPGKVYRNVLKGLDQIQYPYIINGKLDSCQRLWIYNDLSALEELASVPNTVNVLVGPIFTTPRTIPDNIRAALRRTVVLQPSAWSKAMLAHFGFNYCPISCWPVGIDTDEFVPSHAPKDHVLIYFKQRTPAELKIVTEALSKKNIAFTIMTYGNYTEPMFKQELARSRYIIWLGRQESQGIALQEALACDVPILVCDVSRLGHWQPSTPKDAAIFTDTESQYSPVTAAPYFDDTCGVRIPSLEHIDTAIDRMERELTSFTPRAFILKNLSLAGQARAFIDIFEEHYGPETPTKANARRTYGHWKNPVIWHTLSAVWSTRRKALALVKGLTRRIARRDTVQ